MDDTRMLTNTNIIHSDMYLSAGEYLKAVEIMGENGWIDK